MIVFRSLACCRAVQADQRPNRIPLHHTREDSFAMHLPAAVDKEQRTVACCSGKRQNDLIFFEEFHKIGLSY